MDFLELIFGDLPWQAITALTIYGLCLATWRDLWKSEPARKRWCGYLIQNNRYRSIMGGVLDWADARLTPEIAREGRKSTDHAAAWSHNLLSLTLILALAYPLLSLFGIWVYDGAPARIGSFTVIPAEPDPWPRLAVMGLLICSGILFFLASNESKSHPKSRWRPAFFIPAIGILFLFQRVLPADAFAVAGAVAFAVAVAVAVAFAGAFAFAFAFAVAVAFAGAVAFAFAVAVAFAIAGAFAFAFAVAVAFAVAFAFAGAFAGAFAVDWLGKRTGRPTLFLLLWAVLGLVAILVAVSHGDPRLHQIADDSSVILFIGILPLINGLADFASTGLTRYYLRQGLGGSPVLSGIKDLLGGAVIFVALVTATMAIAAWLRWPDGTALLDLPGLLADLRANPGDYWWLYLTFLSTMLPTLLHLGIALFAGVFGMWEGLREYIVEGLTQGAAGDDPKGRWAVRALSATMTAALMLPIMVFGWAIQYHGWVGTFCSTCSNGSRAALA